MLKHPFSALAIAMITAGVASAQNDECTTATALGLGATAFDTSLATLSPELWPCAGNGGPDLWYTYTAANTNDIRIETCGSSYDTALEAFSGACGALVGIVCNDDSCGLQSALTIGNVTAGTVYTFRIGGFNGATGTGTVTISELLAPPPVPPLTANCVETIFAANNGGNIGGAVYFDLTVTQAISIAGLMHNTSTAGAVGVTVFTTPTTFVGQENNMAAWTQVAEDDGTAIPAGIDVPTQFTFVAPFMLAPGTYGIALMGDNFTTGGQMQMNYTNGTGGNQNYTSMDTVLALSLGSATNVPFTGNVFMPRVWNGRLCHGMGSGPGINYCMANANSTGVAAAMSASGSANVTLNNLVLEASDMPNNSFGFFITSLTQGFVANPGGSAGNLCVGGAIGRYVGPGQVQNSGATGGISLAVDNTMQPSPTGFVMVAAGETWNYQAWFRDTTPAGPATSNFTDGLEIIHN